MKWSLVSQSSSSSEVIEAVESDVSSSDQSLLSPGDDASSDVQSSVFEWSRVRVQMIVRFQNILCLDVQVGIIIHEVLSRIFTNSIYLLA